MQKIASSISLIQGRFATSLPKLTDGDVLLIYTFALLAGGYIRRVLDAYLHPEESVPKRRFIALAVYGLISLVGCIAAHAGGR